MQGRCKCAQEVLVLDVFHSIMMCVVYCSACATLRELNVSDVQQPVNDAIANLRWFQLLIKSNECKLGNCSVIPRLEKCRSEALLDSSRIDSLSSL